MTQIEAFQFVPYEQNLFSMTKIRVPCKQTLINIAIGGINLFEEWTSIQSWSRHKQVHERETK
jgi:hypothetical protein